MVLSRIPVEGQPECYFLCLIFISCIYAILPTAHAFGGHQLSHHHYHQPFSVRPLQKEFNHEYDRRDQHILYAVAASESWLPLEIVPTEDDVSDIDAWREETELQAVNLAKDLIQKKILQDEESMAATDDVSTLAKGMFIDLCCTSEGEKRLENIFQQSALEGIEKNVVLGSIACIHSALALGMNFGLTGTPDQFGRWTAHMREPEDDSSSIQDYLNWNSDSTRRLKAQSDRTAAIQLLANLKRKQSAQGAFDLFVMLGVWNMHEDLPLLRSGFPILFSDEELASAENLIQSDSRDPDSILGIRKDFRNMRVVTIDSASTSEIDDGVACEKFTAEDGSEKLRYWIHIADADHIATRDSLSFAMAKKRATSHYLPDISIPMFPFSLSKAMSLTAQTDTYALSLGVELAEDGSIIDSSIVFAPSLVNVNYRLTYDDVDEMLADGVAYREEWELGALFDAAKKRREYRIKNGSAEAFIPRQIPQYTVSAFRDSREMDGMGVSLKVDVSHNGGVNQSSVVETSSHESFCEEAIVSSASVLVTEMMILAGEAIGKWKIFNEKIDGETCNNVVQLAFRGQPAPDYRSRGRERRIMEDLLENNIGDGFCHAWYARRFLSPVKVDTFPQSHSGLGLDCYCQWTSPIRRIGDLQVHCAVKRYLRRKEVFKILERGEDVPPEITSIDLGLDACLTVDSLQDKLISPDTFDQDLNMVDRAAWIRAGRIMQRNSQKYWMLEYLRRLQLDDPNKTFNALVLGCTNPSRRQYALYIYELGLEWRYITPGASLQAGVKFKVQIGNVLPRLGQLNLVRAEF